MIHGIIYRNRLINTTRNQDTIKKNKTKMLYI